MWKKTDLFLLLTLALLLSSCATTTAPSNFLVHPNKVSQNVYGGWIEIEMDNQRKYEGELLAVGIKRIFILKKFGSAVSINRFNIQSAKLTAYSTQRREASLGAFAGTVSSLSHGLYGIITIPSWIIFGSISAGGHTKEAQINYSKNINWSILNHYSRFPQGMPNIKTTDYK